MDLEEYNRKLVAISALIGADEHNPEHFVTRSNLLYERKHYVRAFTDAQAAYSLDQKYLPACIAVGRAAMKLNKHEEAYAFFKEGLIIDPKCQEITENLKDLQKAIIAVYEAQGDQARESAYSAVKLCSQDIYPGDDELFKLENEILANKVKVKAVPLSAAMAVDPQRKKQGVQLGLLAHQYHLAKRDTEALHYCDQALQTDPTNSAQRQLRAEMLYEKEDYQMALQDLISIPKAIRIVDVWRLGGKILQKFELPVMAEFWYRKATNAVVGKDMEAATLFQQLRVKRIYGPLTENYPVTVDFKEYGRAVVATDDLDPEDDAFDDLPVVLGQLLDCSRLPACWHCGASLITAEHFFGSKYEELSADLKALATEQWPDVRGFKCAGCDTELYCSEACRDEAWTRYHQVLCPSVNEASSELYEMIEKKGFGYNMKGEWDEVWLGMYSPIIMAKIWGMIVTETKRLMEASGHKEPNTEHWARAKMPFRKFISFGNTSAVERMPTVFQMMKNIFKNCGTGFIYDITEPEFEARYYQATCNLQAFSASVTPKHKFMDNLSKLEDLRVLRMVKYLEEKEPAVSFAGMFPLHACLNHSCDNNADVMNGFVDGRPAVHVRVKRHIEKGEELFTTYIDTAMSRKLRRAWLFKSFNFWCFCLRCQFEGDDSTSCTHCKKPAADGKVFPGCGKCKKAWYCSSKCQKQAWLNGHKRVCSTTHSKVQKLVS